MKIAIIGAGNMGGAIARGIAANMPDVTLAVSNPSTPKLEALKSEFPAIEVSTKNATVAKDADFVVLAVKPRLILNVLDEIYDDLDPVRQALVSVAGGMSIDDIEELVDDGRSDIPAMFQVIPDTAAAVGRSMTFIASRRASKAMVAKVVEIFGCLGKVAVIEPRLMDAATALCSCGIAYVYKFVQACVQAGVQLGFTPADALKYVNATIDGAVAMLEAGGTSPQQEIDKVTTPGGMTIKGINQLEHAGFTSAVISGILKPLEK